MTAGGFDSAGSVLARRAAQIPKSGTVSENHAQRRGSHDRYDFAWRHRPVASRRRDRRRGGDGRVRRDRHLRRLAGRHRLGCRRTEGRILPVLSRRRDHRWPAWSISLARRCRRPRRRCSPTGRSCGRCSRSSSRRRSMSCAVPWAGIYLCVAHPDRGLHEVARPLQHAMLRRPCDRRRRRRPI